MASFKYSSTAATSSTLSKESFPTSAESLNLNMESAFFSESSYIEPSTDDRPKQKHTAHEPETYMEFKYVYIKILFFFYKLN